MRRSPVLPLFGYRRRDDAAGSFLWAEPGAERVTGWSPEELRAGAVGYWDFLRPARRERVSAEIAVALREERDFAVLYTLRGRDGRRTVVVDRGRGEADGVIEGCILQLSGIPRVDRDFRQARHLRALPDLANEVMLELDAAGRVLDVSPNCERVFGNRPEQVIGRSGIEMARPQDRDLIRTALQRLVPGGPPASFTVHLGDRDGRPVWIEGTVAMYRAPDRDDRYVAVVRDVSERRERVRALAASEAKFATAFQSSPVGMSLTSLAGDELIEANPSFWRMLGLDPVWTPERDARMRSIWARDERKEPTLARLRESGGFEGRGRFRLLSGELRDMRITARIVSLPERDVILWQLIDLTEEYLAQRALRESDLLYRRLVESCPLGIATLDPEHRFTTANAALRQLLGVPDAEPLVGRDARVLAGPAWRSIESDVLRAIAGGEPRRIEFAFETPWGQRIQARTHLAPLEDADGKETGALAVVEDVGRWRRMEEQVRHSQKMEALGQLAAGAAHDFQNWLLVIDSHAQEIEARLPPDEGLRAAAGQIRRATLGATGLAKQLLAFGRVSRQCPRVLDLNATLARGQGLWQTLVPDRIQIVLELGARLPRVWADPAGIDQLVLNLVINARDAMPGGGRISVATRALVLPDPALAGELDLPPGRYLQLSVQDTGAGIPEDVRERIFEPFFTTKPAGAGSGLGLTMAHAIVVESGGQIVLADEDGVGSRFDVYLPAVPEDDAEERR